MLAKNFPRSVWRYRVTKQIIIRKKLYEYMLAYWPMNAEVSQGHFCEISVQIFFRNLGIVKAFWSEIHKPSFCSFLDYNLQYPPKCTISTSGAKSKLKKKYGPKVIVITNSNVMGRQIHIKLCWKAKFPIYL